MTAHTAAQNSAPASGRFDAEFIEKHRLIERYLDDKLPVKGARDLENWYRANPDHLAALKLSDRAQATLRLLEACGKPLDLSEPKPAWWRSPYIPIALAIIALLCLTGFWILLGKHVLLQQQLEDVRARMENGTLQPPAAARDLRISPDHAPGIDRARVVVSRSAPLLMDLHIDMSYTKAVQFRMLVDKRDQGRALILNNLIKDSNGELRLTFNTTGLAAGVYTVRIEALPSRGGASPVPEGWMILEVK